MLYLASHPFCPYAEPGVPSSWWRHQMETFPRYWPIVRGIHRSQVNSPHRGQWHRALIFSLICAWTNGSANNRDAGDLRRYCAHYDATVIYSTTSAISSVVYSDDLQQGFTQSANPGSLLCICMYLVYRCHLLYAMKLISAIYLAREKVV